MKITLTKLSDETHRFAYVRPDGTGATLELVTRSFLFHDLLHFALESEAGLKSSFYGRLAAGAAVHAAEADGTPILTDEALLTERLVGVLTGTLKGEASGEAAVEGAARILATFDQTPPDWFTPAFVARVRERMRVLIGRWKATRFGNAMQLEFRI